jgi:hypothetical protein
VRVVIRSALTLSFICSWFIVDVQPTCADFAFDDFNDSAGLAFVGSATTVDGRLRLTPAAQDRAGAAWQITKQRVVDGFECMFEFQITEVGNGGSDGIWFAVQDNGTEDLGCCADDALGAELDTWDSSVDGVDDPNGNHLSFLTAPNTVLASSTSIPNLSDGNVHVAKIEYVPGTVRAFVDDLDNPALVHSFDLAKLLPDGDAWVGLFSFTGFAFENHDILSWSFIASLEATQTPTSSPTADGYARRDVYGDRIGNTDDARHRDCYSHTNRHTDTDRGRKLHAFADCNADGHVHARTNANRNTNPHDKSHIRRMRWEL